MKRPENGAPAIITRDPTLHQLERRLLLKGALSMGGLALLSGCKLDHIGAVQHALLKVSSWNDRVQAAIFSENHLAPEYPASMIHRPFRFNAYYPPEEAPAIDPQTYRLALAGRIRDKRPWRLEELYRLPYTTQITRHVCVEGWSMIGKWGGTPFRGFLERIGADLSCRYVGFQCADNYYTSIDMATALHPQTLLAFTFDDQILPRIYGFPMKLRIPTKLGFKNPKHIIAIFVTNAYPGGYWEDQGYNWFSGL